MLSNLPKASLLTLTELMLESLPSALSALQDATWLAAGPAGRGVMNSPHHPPFCSQQASKLLSC